MNREQGIDVLETTGRRRPRLGLSLLAVLSLACLSATAGAAWQKRQIMANPTTMARARAAAAPTLDVDNEIAVMLRDARASIATLKALRDQGNRSAEHALKHLADELR